MIQRLLIENLYMVRKYCKRFINGEYDCKRIHSVACFLIRVVQCYGGWNM